MVSIDPKTTRERHRKERGTAEAERMIARYKYECGDVKVYRPNEKGELELVRIIPNENKREEDALSPP